MPPLKITEVGPRDGLQNQPQVVLTDTKADFIHQLALAGHRFIEVTSMVHPAKVPQLADAEALLSRLSLPPEVCVSVLVPNVKGLHRVLHARQHGAKIDQISVFTATSDLFTQKNINMSVQASLEAFQPVIQQAKAEGLLVRGYVSTVVACPYEGLIAPQKVLEISQALFDLGVDELSLGETLGIAVPNQIDALLTLLLEHIPVNRLALHCHDTYGTALANICKALERGITSFDSASGGLGGCPYAPGASGNIATEDLLYLLQQSGLSTGIDLEGQIQASLLMEKALQQRLPSKVLQAKRASNCVT